MPASSSKYVSGLGTETCPLITSERKSSPGERETFAQKTIVDHLCGRRRRYFRSCLVPSTGVQPLPWRELHRRRALDEAQKHPQKPERAAKIAQALAMADQQPLHMAEIEVFSEFAAAL